MKGTKKISMILVALALILLVAGCSSGQKADTSSEAGNSTEGSGDSETIVWGTNAAFAPFEMREGDEVIGIDADVAKKIADKLGVELVVEDMDFDSLLPALVSGKIDFIAAGYTKKPDREEQVLFTDTYFKATQAIIVKEGGPEINSLEDLVGKTIGVQNATTGDFEASDIEDAEVVRFKNGIEAALDLNNGKLDAVIIDNYPAKMLVENNPGLVIVETEEPIFEDEEYAIAVQKGNEELQKVINQVLKEMKDAGEFEEMINKYSMGE